MQNKLSVGWNLTKALKSTLSLIFFFFLKTMNKYSWRSRKGSKNETTHLNRTLEKGEKTEKGKKQKNRRKTIRTIPPH